MPKMKKIAIMAALLPLAGCGNSGSSNVTAEDAQSYDGISAKEVLHFSGTEPFWGGEVVGQTLTYTTPEEPDGQTITAKRFEGLNGLGYSGELDGGSFDMAVTPGDCSDGMSDRAYPFTITLRLGSEERIGCGWTDAKPFSGDENP